MKAYQISCPACGATLEIEEGRVTCFCSYCGKKINIDDGIKRVEITKNINYHKIYTDEARIRESEAKERMQDKKYAAKKDENKSQIITFLTIIGSLLVVLLIISVFFASEKKESDEQEKELREIVEEVMEDIDDGDFEAAYIKAETIYYTAGWSSDIEDKWDATRKELIEQIEAAEKKAKKEKKESEGKDTWWNPFD